MENHSDMTEEIESDSYLARVGSLSDSRLHTCTHIAPIFLSGFGSLSAHLSTSLSLPLLSHVVVPS